MNQPIGSSTTHCRRALVVDVTITVGTHNLAADTIFMFPDLPRETSPTDAELSLGTSAFSDRLLMISYSSRNVWIGQPGQD